MFLIFRVFGKKQSKKRSMDYSIPIWIFWHSNMIFRMSSLDVNQSNQRESLNFLILDVHQASVFKGIPVVSGTKRSSGTNVIVIILYF